MFQISVVNRSKTLSDLELQAAIRAVNRQIAADFEPHWAFGGELRLAAPVGAQTDLSRLPELRGDAILYVLDEARSSDVLGYHDRNLHGVPYGFVYLDLCEQLGDPWTAILSHEALELIADPQANLLVEGPDPRDPQRTVYHYYEVCDAVQAAYYEIDGIKVANFLLPLYFTPRNEAGGRNDFAGVGVRSFKVHPGGYIGYFDPATGKAKTYALADDAEAERRMQVKGAAGAGRVFKRANAPSLPNRETIYQAVREGTQPTGTAIRAAAPMPAVSPDAIRHVVILMLENRSFDHMLGALTQADGVKPGQEQVNIDSAAGTAYKQAAGASRKLVLDVPHEHVDVMEQIDGPMLHFVDAYVKANAGKAGANPQEVMAYFALGTLPVLHELAQSFTVCDRWFSSLPGPTWPNRLFVHSGTSRGDVTMPTGGHLSSLGRYLGRYNQPTIYDRLETAGVSYRIYYGDVPQSIVLTRMTERWFIHPGAYARFEKFLEQAQGSEAEFPSYAFVEPAYYSTLGPESDQHPPADLMQGEVLLAKVYNALRANADLWKSTLLIVTYDEHGGFYDHVPPPATIAPDDERRDGFDFSRLGVRVPALLISPWVKKTVDSTEFEHSSILRYACEKWGLETLGRRVDPTEPQAVKSFAPLITNVFRSDTPDSVAVPTVGALVPSPQAEVDGPRGALLSYVEALKARGGEGVAGGEGEQVVTGAAGELASAPVAALHRRARPEQRRAQKKRPAARVADAKAWLESRRAGAPAAAIPPRLPKATSRVSKRKRSRTRKSR